MAHRTYFRSRHADVVTSFSLSKPIWTPRKLIAGPVDRALSVHLIGYKLITRPLQWYDLPPGSKNVLFKVSFTSQTSGSNNKLDIGTFKLGHPRLTNSKTNNK